jgi:hypothetical protein
MRIQIKECLQDAARRTAAAEMGVTGATPAAAPETRSEGLLAAQAAEVATAAAPEMALLTSVEVEARAVWMGQSVLTSVAGSAAAVVSAAVYAKALAWPDA